MQYLAITKFTKSKNNIQDHLQHPIFINTEIYDAGGKLSTCNITNTENTT